MIDTSGSMAYSATNNPALGETDPLSRMDRLKAALIQVLNRLPNDINVGLGRYSGSEGGAIVFPVTRLDATLASVTGATQHFTDAYTSVGGGSEAEELIPDPAPSPSTTPANPRNVTFVNNLSPKQIRLGTLTPFRSTVDTTPPPPPPVTLPPIPINNLFDEAEQWDGSSGAGTVETGDVLAAPGNSSNRRCGVLNSNSAVKGVIELVTNVLTYSNSGGNSNACIPSTTGNPDRQRIGLRFVNVNVPKTATRACPSSRRWTCRRRSTLTQLAFELAVPVAQPGPPLRRLLPRAHRELGRRDRASNAHPSPADDWALTGATSGTGNARLVSPLGIGRNERRQQLRRPSRRVRRRDRGDARRHRTSGRDRVLRRRRRRRRRVRHPGEVRARAVVERLRAEGARIGYVRPITLLPFPSEIDGATVAAGARTVAVYENSQGQMVDDVRLAVEGRCRCGSSGG